jgi:hypothetical protein
MRKSWGWKATFGLAAIAIGAFVLFDVLDLDGSQIRAQSAECALAETNLPASDRLGGAQPVPDPLGATFLLPSPSAAPETPWLTRHNLRTHAPRSATLAHGRARSTLVTTHGSPSASDPA